MAFWTKVKEPEIPLGEVNPYDMSRNILVRWTPQKDITAYELAQLVPALTPAYAWALKEDEDKTAPASWWDPLPPELRRHFTLVQDPRQPAVHA